MGGRGVILDELTLHNFGVFRGRHSLKLTPPAESQPITLIAGLNGCGKTTILDAVQLALYGPLARVGSRRGAAYEQFLSQSIHHSVDRREGAAIELDFHAYQDGVRHDYHVHRSWAASGQRLRERLEIAKDGHHDSNLTEHWADQVEAFIPRGIASLFLFDGEQIESLADLENSKSVLRTAINALLGLDLADRLTADLTVLERRTREKTAPIAQRQEIEHRREQVGELRRLEEHSAQELAASRGRLERSEKQLSAVEQRYRMEGGELFEQRTTIEQHLSSARQELKSLDDELRELAGGAAPLLLVRDQLREMTDLAEKEQLAIQDRILSAVLTERDAALLDALHSARANKSTIAAVECFLDSDRATRAATVSQAPFLDLDSENTNFALALVQNLLPDLISRLRLLSNRRQEWVTTIEQLERSLAGVPAPDTLAQLAEELREARNEVARAQADFRRSEGQLTATRSERARADERYEQAIDAAGKATLAAEDEHRMIEHAQRVRQTLQAFRVATTRRHVDRIAGLVMEALHQLLRKELLITDLRIDPETYTVELRGERDEELLASQLSAGERQLLAVALLWGLARAAGQPLPVIIDTPLGRLDGSHRDRLIERYFPHASHQVILLSTDQEIDEAAWVKLRRYVGHAYELEFDEITAGTTIRSGYFW
jgi:DNA sulfur modification protein DndD